MKNYFHYQQNKNKSPTIYGELFQSGKAEYTCANQSIGHLYISRFNFHSTENSTTTLYGLTPIDSEKERFYKSDNLSSALSKLVCKDMCNDDHTQCGLISIRLNVED